MDILIVITSRARLGATETETGYWFEELATPYYLFADAGAELTLASPKGGRPPMDPKSLKDDFQSPATRRMTADADAQAALDATVPLAEVAAAGFDAVFYPGGHGLLWDLADDPDSKRLIEGFYAAGKPVAAVCHAGAALLKPEAEGGGPLIAGKKVTGFTNGEEAMIERTHLVPYLLEDAMKAAGAKYSKGPDWGPYTVTDGHLITGQNPASSAGVAEALLAALRG